MNCTKNLIDPKLYIIPTENLIELQDFSGVHVMFKFYQDFSGVHVMFRFYQVFSGVHVKFKFYQVFSGVHVMT
jgi:hypothetical protein